MNDYPTPDDILKLVETRRQQMADEQSRELVLAEVNVLPEVPREVYKDEKIERCKDVSRDLREESDCLASPPFGELPPPPLPQVVLGNESGPRELTSRGLTLSGITVQHSKTTKGIKLSITLQKVDQASTGDIISVTAELKRNDRLRELKAYSGDTYEFTRHYQDTIENIRVAGDNARNVCIGRVHNRGKRSAWVANMLVVGTLNQQDHIIHILLYYQNEEYEVHLDLPLTTRQAEMFHTSGRYGNLCSGSTAPTLDSLPTTKYRP
jgi:hypothetical protein